VIDLPIPTIRGVPSDKRGQNRIGRASKTRHLLDEAGDHLRENAIFSLKRVTFRCLSVAAYDNFSALASDRCSVMFAWIRQNKANQTEKSSGFVREQWIQVLAIGMHANAFWRCWQRSVSRSVVCSSPECRRMHSAPWIRTLPGDGVLRFSPLPTRPSKMRPGII